MNAGQGVTVRGGQPPQPIGGNASASKEPRELGFGERLASVIHSAALLLQKIDGLNAHLNGVPEPNNAQGGADIPAAMGEKIDLAHEVLRNAHGAMDTLNARF